MGGINVLGNKLLWYGLIVVAFQASYTKLANTKLESLNLHEMKALSATPTQLSQSIRKLEAKIPPSQHLSRFADTDDGRQAKALTVDLPEVDEVTIWALDRPIEKPPRNAYHDRYPILGRKNFKGLQAQKLASLWRSLVFCPEAGLCHEPPYALTFRYHGKPVFDASICWECQNFDARNSEGKSIGTGFESNNPNANALLNELRTILRNKSLEKALSKAR